MMFNYTAMQEQWVFYKQNHIFKGLIQDETFKINRENLSVINLIFNIFKLFLFSGRLVKDGEFESTVAAALCDHRQCFLSG
jgi:hypothetical protein